MNKRTAVILQFTVAGVAIGAAAAGLLLRAGAAADRSLILQQTIGAIIAATIFCGFTGVLASRAVPADRRTRPMSAPLRGAAILACLAALFAAGAVVWRAAGA